MIDKVKEQYHLARKELQQRYQQHKPMMLMLVSVIILFGLIFGYKVFTNYLMTNYLHSMGAPIVTVSATQVKYEDWQPILKAPGTVRAILGVDVTTELAGLVRHIHFIPGQNVQKGDLLVELNDDAEKAQLQNLKALAELAQVVYNRDKAQFDIKAVSQAVVDADAADLKAKLAQVDEQAAIVAKKSIRAPFDGRLGINYVNPGQYLSPGDKVVTLQSLNPIYVDFTLPQQNVVDLKLGLTVKIKMDGFPDKVFMGEMSTIDPRIDPATRNLQLESTVNNSELKLLPGMYCHVALETGTTIKRLTLPQTAISFNPYGDIVYVINQSDKKDKQGKPELLVKQTFVKLGEKRGDQVAVLEGIKEGDQVVIAGQNKLNNGTRVIINNSVLPKNEAFPTPVNE